MAATVTRELTVTYAGLSIGGTSDTHLLFDSHEVRGGYETIGFTGRVLVCGSSEADFATNCASLETAFQTPNGTLVIQINSTSLKSFGHSGSTGFLGRPSYRKIGGKEDTGRSRLYEVRVDAQRPADLSGKNGLRVAEISVKTNFFASRSYRVSGTYTAISSTSARAQYAAQVGTLLTSIESDLAGSPGTWLRLDADVRYDDTNKIATFTQDAVETGLRDGSYSLSTSQTGLRSYRITGTYTAVGGTSASASYSSSIGALLDNVEALFGGSGWLRGASSYTIDQGDKLCRFEYAAIETGLRDAVYAVTTSPSGVRDYRLTGVFEDTSTNALAAMPAAVATVLSAWESSLTGTWERQPIQYEQNQNNTLVPFTATARELIFNQSSSTLDNTTLRNTKIRIERLSVAPGDSSSAVRRPIRLMIQFDTDVVKSATQDLKTTWETLVLEYLVTLATNAADASTVAVVESRPVLDPVANRISGSIVVEGYVGDLIGYEAEIDDVRPAGLLHVEVYSGDPDEVEEFQLARATTRTITARMLTIGWGEPTPPDSVLEAGYVRLLTNPRRKRLVVGLAGNQVNVTLTTWTEQQRYRKVRTYGASSDGRISTGGKLFEGLP